jgi:hypothetical protein
MQEASSPVSTNVPANVDSEHQNADDNPETYRALRYKCRLLQKRMRYLGTKLGSMRSFLQNASIYSFPDVLMVTCAYSRALLLKTRAETAFLAAKAKQLGNSKAPVV